jgi:hypothetical protein
MALDKKCKPLDYVVIMQINDVFTLQSAETSYSALNSSDMLNKSA